MVRIVLLVFTFLKAGAAPLRADLGNDVPHEAPRDGIDARRGLVEEHHLQKRHVHGGLTTQPVQRQSMFPPD